MNPILSNTQAVLGILALLVTSIIWAVATIARAVWRLAESHSQYQASLARVDDHAKRLAKLEADAIQDHGQLDGLRNKVVTLSGTARQLTEDVRVLSELERRTYDSSRMPDDTVERVRREAARIGAAREYDEPLTPIPPRRVDPRREP